MKGWEESKRASDVYLDEIKQILGLHLIGEPPIEEDQQRNTDLIVIRMEALRIACRVRSFEYLKKYHHEFTVRSSRFSGAKTEYQKIFDGWGDYMFYGFGDNGYLMHWNLIDLDVFRNHIENAMPIEKPNTDMSSTFKVFKICDFPDELIVAKKSFFTAPVMQAIIEAQPESTWRKAIMDIADLHVRERVKSHLISIYKMRNAL